MELNHENSGEKTIIYLFAKKLYFDNMKVLIEMNAHPNLYNLKKTFYLLKWLGNKMVCLRFATTSVHSIILPLLRYF